MPPSNLLYTYINRNLLEEPEYYMYSAFGGTSFLNEYLSLRHEHLFLLEKNYLTLLQNDDYIYANKDSHIEWFTLCSLLQAEIGDVFSTDIQALHLLLIEKSYSGQKLPILFDSLVELDSLNELPTQYILYNLLLTMVSSKNLELDRVYTWLSRLLKSFEVNKILYDKYTPKMRPINQDFCKEVNYALLSLSLILYYQQTGNLKMLNGALKLNDLLCSIFSMLTEPMELCLTIFSLHQELSTVKQLALAKGVLE